MLTSYIDIAMCFPHHAMFDVVAVTLMTLEIPSVALISSQEMIFDFGIQEKVLIDKFNILLCLYHSKVIHW